MLGNTGIWMEHISIKLHWMLIERQILNISFSKIILTSWHIYYLCLFCLLRLHVERPYLHITINVHCRTLTGREKWISSQRLRMNALWNLSFPINVPVATVYNLHDICTHTCTQMPYSLCVNVHKPADVNTPQRPELSHEQKATDHKRVLKLSYTLSNSRRLKVLWMSITTVFSVRQWARDSQFYLHATLLKSPVGNSCAGTRLSQIDSMKSIRKHSTFRIKPQKCLESAMVIQGVAIATTSPSWMQGDWNEHRYVA